MKNLWKTWRKWKQKEWSISPAEAALIVTLIDRVDAENLIRENQK